MKNVALVHRLAEIVNDDLELLSRNSMIKVDGNYKLFNAYTVVKNPNKTCTVIKHRRDPRIFSNIQSAVAWCIADKLQRFDTARQISELDQRCNTIRNDIELTQKMIVRITDSARREIVTAKLVHKQSTFKVIENQLTKCINLAKYWQIKGFIRDETARPRNPTTTR